MQAAARGLVPFPPEETAGTGHTQSPPLRLSLPKTITGGSWEEARCWGQLALALLLVRAHSRRATGENQAAFMQTSLLPKPRTGRGDAACLLQHSARDQRFPTINTSFQYDEVVLFE